MTDMYLGVEISRNSDTYKELQQHVHEEGAISCRFRDLIITYATKTHANMSKTKQ